MTWLQIRVELRDASIAIWRELLVPGDLPLPDLHRLLQAAMGWEDSHLHSFAQGSQTYWQSRTRWVMDDPDGLLEHAETDVPESGAVVGDLLPAAGTQATYLYDFGDDWEHLLTLTDVLDGDSSAVADLTSPVLTDGEGVCPPEDCGGVPGHAGLLESVAALEAGDELEEWPEQGVRWAFGTLDVEQIRAALTFDLARQQERVAALSRP